MAKTCALLVAALLLARSSNAQVNVISADSLRRMDSLLMQSQRAAIDQFDDSLRRFNLRKPDLSAIAIQFIAGDAAWSSAFFAVGGAQLLNPADYQAESRGSAFFGATSFVSALIVTPLSIHLATSLLGYKTQSLWLPYLGGYLGTLGGIYLWGAITRTTNPVVGYLALSLSTVAFTLLCYDLQF